MSSKTRLRALTLAGFQSIRDRTTIELAPVTLLYGPNSAGKSAVADALWFLRHVFDPQSPNDARVLEELEATAFRWWHQPPGTLATDEIGMSLGVTVWARLSRVPTAEFYDHFDPDGPLAKWMFAREKPRELGVELTFVGRRHLYAPVDVTYSVDGEWILTCRGDGKATFALNAAHPLLLEPNGFLDEVLGHFSNVLELSLLNPEEGKSWLYEEEGQGIAANTSWGQHSVDLRSIWRIARSRAGDAHTSKLPESWVQPLTFLLELFGEVVLDSVHDALSMASIEGARLPPTGEELRTSADWMTRLRSRPVSSVGDAIAMLLADHCRRAEDKSHPVPSLSAWVDACLADHLFRESGYAISPKVRFELDVSRGELARTFDLPLSEPGERLGGVATHQEIGTYITRYVEQSFGRHPSFNLHAELRLLDNHGRWLELADIGCGIGYVLPCLVAWWYPLSFVSQPELHLHPALQAELGDVLIEAVQAGRQVIVESHSEHLILRLLRRVRQSAAPTQARQASLDPYEVAIFYFDPQPEGATVVKQVRVSRGGELLDHWPRGFFTERVQELFE